MQLDWATATPLTILEPGSARPTLVLAAGRGIPVDLKFAPGTTVRGAAFDAGNTNGTAGDNAASGPASGAGLLSSSGPVSGAGLPSGADPVSGAGAVPGADLLASADGVWRASAAEPQLIAAHSGNGTLDILVLPAEIADQAWVFDGELVLSDGPVWTVPGGLAGRSLGRPSLQRFSRERRGFVAVDVAVDVPADLPPACRLRQRLLLMPRFLPITRLQQRRTLLLQRLESGQRARRRPFCRWPARPFQQF